MSTSTPRATRTGLHLLFKLLGFELERGQVADVLDCMSVGTRTEWADQLMDGQHRGLSLEIPTEEGGVSGAAQTRRIRIKSGVWRSQQARSPPISTTRKAPLRHAGPCSGSRSTFLAPVRARA